MSILIYTKPGCPNCDSAKALLKSKGLEFYTIDVLEDPEAFLTLVKAYPDARQMPQIFVQGQRVGGLAGLQAALAHTENKQ